LAVEGLHSATDVHLALWHGPTRELVVSMGLVVLGLGLYYAGRKVWWGMVRVPAWLQFDRGFERGLDGLSTFAKRLTRGLRSDEPLDYLPIIVGFSVCLVGGSLLGLFGPSAVEGLRWWGGWSEVNSLRVLVASLIALSVLGVMVLKGWATQLIALSVSGFLICFYFVLYRAPDLALTQILVEVVTLFMILILLGRFPRSAERGEIMHRPPKRRSALNACLALGLGGTVTLFILVVSAAPGGDRLGAFFLENTVPLAEGSNAVNTILVDFRGFDTLGEITVLVVAMLGCLGLLMRYRRSKAEYRAGPMGPPGYGIDDPTGERRERS
jgi:multisubunit Na+/H+ antiporter MnhB subunit